MVSLLHNEFDCQNQLWRKLCLSIHKNRYNYKQLNTYGFIWLHMELYFCIIIKLWTQNSTKHLECQLEFWTNIMIYNLYSIQEPLSILVVLAPSKEYVCRECVSTGAAGARTRRFLEHHLLHPLILRLLVLLSSFSYKTGTAVLAMYCRFGYRTVRLIEL